MSVSRLPCHSPGNGGAPVGVNEVVPDFTGPHTQWETCCCFAHSLTGLCLGPSENTAQS